MTEPKSPLHDWLVSAVEAEASDLHVVAGYPPMLRIHGQLRNLNETAEKYLSPGTRV